MAKASPPRIRTILSSTRRLFIKCKSTCSALIDRVIYAIQMRLPNSHNPIRGRALLLRRLRRRSGSFALPGMIGLLIALLLASSSSASAQIQEAWVAKYNNGIPNGNHQALKMTLDTQGNVYVLGVSQNALTNTGYAVIKYAPKWQPASGSTGATLPTFQRRPRQELLLIAVTNALLSREVQ